MRFSNWRFRAVALLQLLLALPPLVSGSICFSADGSAKPEFGSCACDVPFVGAAEATIATAGAADCGPCRDEAFRATRHVPPAAPEAPSPSLFAAAPWVVVAARFKPSHRLLWLGQPPGERLSILRC